MKKVLCSVLALLMLFSVMALTIHAETPVEETGLFSPERWVYAGEMLALGVGMVFLVLAILWGILTIFAKTMGGVKKSAKKEKPAKVETKPAPAPTAAPAPAVAASDDAIVAAITAAIAMTIDSDPALSSQFAGGFRVVSFQKKNGKTSWNH